MKTDQIAVKIRIIVFVLLMACSGSSCAQDPKETGMAPQRAQPSKTVMKTVRIPVEGMTCSACQANVTKTIKGIKGVADVDVSLEHKYAEIVFDPEKVKIEDIQKAINDKGYTAGKPKDRNN